MSLAFLSSYTEQKVTVEEAPKVYRWWEVQKPQWTFVSSSSNFLRDPRIHSILPKDYHFTIPEKSNEKSLPSGRISELHALLAENNSISVSNNAITIEKIDKYEDENRDTLNVGPNPRTSFTKSTPVRKSMIDMKKIEIHKETKLEDQQQAHEAPVTLSVPTSVNNSPEVNNQGAQNNNNNNNHNNHVANNETTSTPVNNEINHAKETSSAGEVKLRRVAPQKRNVARTLSIQIPKSSTSIDLSKTGGLPSKPIKKLVIKKKFPEGQPSNPTNISTGPSVKVGVQHPAQHTGQQHSTQQGSLARDNDILAKLRKLDDLMEALELDFTEVMVADQWGEIRSIVKDLKTTMVSQGKKAPSPVNLPPTSGDIDPIDTLLESL